MSLTRATRRCGISWRAPSKGRCLHALPCRGRTMASRAWHGHPIAPPPADRAATAASHIPHHPRPGWPKPRSGRRGHGTDIGPSDWRAARDNGVPVSRRPCRVRHPCTLSIVVEARQHGQAGRSTARRPSRGQPARARSCDGRNARQGMRPGCRPVSGGHGRPLARPTCPGSHAAGCPPLAPRRARGFAPRTRRAMDIDTVSKFATDTNVPSSMDTIGLF